MDRTSFFTPRKLEEYEVEIAGLGKVRAREISESEKTHGWELWRLNTEGDLDKRKLKDQKLKLITLCLIDDSGELLLTEKDLPELRKFPATIITQLTQLAMKCAGLSEDDLGEQLKKKLPDSPDATAA